MAIFIKLDVCEPQNNLVKITYDIEIGKDLDSLILYFPKSSKKNFGELIRTFATKENGVALNFNKRDEYSIEIELEKGQKRLHFSYQLVSSSFSFKESYVDTSFSTLISEQVFLAIEGKEHEEIELEIKFFEGWSKINTVLEDISEKRDIFKYGAESYKKLVSSSIELGCYETDGFRSQNKNHYLLYEGNFRNKESEFKEFTKELYKRLENKQINLKYSQFKIFCLLGPCKGPSLCLPESLTLFGDQVSVRTEKGFKGLKIELCRAIVSSLSKNFHVASFWELGFKNYLGLKLALQTSLISQEEYIYVLEQNIKDYLSHSGKKFQTLEDGYFYSHQSSKQYHINIASKSFLIALLCDIELYKRGSDLFLILNEKNPEDFLKTKLEKKTFERLELAFSTTEDIDFYGPLKDLGLESVYGALGKLHFGLKIKYLGERVFIDHVELDGPCHKADLAKGDEILSIDGLRVLKSNFTHLCHIDDAKSFLFLVARNGKLSQFEVRPSKAQKKFLKIRPKSQEALEAFTQAKA